MAVRGLAGCSGILITEGHVAGAMSERVEQRHDWSLEEIADLLQSPLMDLLWSAQGVHRAANPGYKVQLASLLSVKTGGCEEDCAYCPQSMHHSSDVTGQPDLEVKAVLDRARIAAEAGADRFCMGWAWREIREGPAFESMLAMVRGVRELGLEACVTAGMLTDSQAERLAEAGLTAYNHNLDTSPSITRTSSPRAPTRATGNASWFDRLVSHPLRRNHRHGRVAA